MKNNLLCSICYDGFINWILTIGMPEKSIDRFMNKILYPSEKLYQIVSENNKNFIIRTDDSLYRWPGFYCGLIDNSYPIWVIQFFIIFDSNLLSKTIKTTK